MRFSINILAVLLSSLPMICFSELDSKENFFEVSEGIILEKGFLKTPQDTIKLMKSLQSKSFLPRDYDRLMTQDERESLSYLLGALANNSLASISFNKSSLQKAALKLERIHPLRVIITIFNDPKLNSDMHKIRSRSFIWGELFSQYSTALDQEYSFSNILPHVTDFSRELAVDENYLLPSIESADWQFFFDQLLAL